MQKRSYHIRRLIFIAAVAILCDAWTGGTIIESIMGGYKPKPRHPPSRTESTGGRKPLSFSQ